jgi:hypothetical protein
MPREIPLDEGPATHYGLEADRVHPSRCACCGASWPKSRTGEYAVCDVRCALGLTEMLMGFAMLPADEEKAAREAAEHLDASRRWRIGRDFGRGEG